MFALEYLHFGSMSSEPLLKGEEPEWPVFDLNKINEQGLTTAEYKAALEKYGKNEIPEVKESLCAMYFKQFVGPMQFMIEIAAVLSLLNKSYADFAIIMALLFTNGTLGFFEEKAAQASVDALKNNLEAKVQVVRDGTPTQTEVTDIVPGDIIFLRGGNVIPADAYWFKGDFVQVDQAALTGESLPVTVPRAEEDKGLTALDGKPAEGKRLFSGAILRQGECYGVVEKTGIYTMMGDAAASIQESGGKHVGLFEGKIIQAARVLILITLCVVGTLSYYYLAVRGKELGDVLESSLSLIIASVPVALPMVMKVTMSIGAKEMADEGGIVTHLTALEEIASMRVLCSDKTGTLTKGKMDIKYDDMKGYSNIKPEEALLYASVASNAANKEDPIDTAVFKALNKFYGFEVKDPDLSKNMAATKLKERFQLIKYYGFNAVVKRTVAHVKDTTTGREMYIAKGIVNKILKTDAKDEGEIQWEVKDYEAMKKTVAADDADLGKRGFKTIGVAIAPVGGTFTFIGLLPISDPPRDDTAQTIRNIRGKQIYVKMITGDHLNIAKEIGRQIDLGTNILPSSELASEYSSAKKDNVLFADGFAQVYPKDKEEVVCILQDQGMVVGMTGDGVNDAPALAKAQIGIAVEGATDAAKSAADIVLTNPGLSPINTAVEISRRIFKRLKSYVIYRICITVQVVFFLTVIAFTSNATFRALYIILLALLHDLQIVTIAYDKQIAGDAPETPTVMGLLIVSYAMGMALCGSTVYMYYHGGSFLDPLFLTNSDYHDAAIFFQISNSSAILIFSARSVKWWFSPLFNAKIPAPAKEIVISAMIGQFVIMGVIAFTDFLPALTMQDIGSIWLYDLVWLFILDIVKQSMIALWEGYEEANKADDPFIRQERKSATSMEKNTPGRGASFKRNSLKR